MSVSSEKQLKTLNKFDQVPKFGQKLKEIGLYPFKPFEIEIFQINLGYLCNLTCKHCHVGAGPRRTEIMGKKTMQQCLNAIDQLKPKMVDLTGGEPEMIPDFEWLIGELSKRDIEILVRTNLVIFFEKGFSHMPHFLAEHKVTLYSSMPCYTEDNVDQQRGKGVYNTSIKALKLLNSLGYGKKDSDLKLNLVYNPSGDFLPGSQSGLEKDYKKQLSEEGIEFNNLLTLTNLPINRFFEFLERKNRTEKYLKLLEENFNPSAAMGVMCRNTISIGWDGTIYDCDFNQTLGLKVDSNVPQNIKDFDYKKLENRNIIINQHCYGCTAGEGSSCQGSIV